MQTFELLIVERRMVVDARWTVFLLLAARSDLLGSIAF